MPNTNILPQPEAGIDQLEALWLSPDHQVQHEVYAERFGIPVEQAVDIEVGLVAQIGFMEGVDDNREGIRSRTSEAIDVILDANATEEQKLTARTRLLSGRAIEQTLLMAVDLVSQPPEARYGGWLGQVDGVPIHEQVRQLDSVKAQRSPFRPIFHGSKQVKQTVRNLRWQTQSLIEQEDISYFADGKVRALKSESSRLIIDLADRLPVQTLAKLVEQPSFQLDALTSNSVEPEQQARMVGALVKRLQNEPSSIASERLVGLLVSARNSAMRDAEYPRDIDEPTKQRNHQSALLFEHALTAIGYRADDTDAPHNEVKLATAMWMNLDEQPHYEANVHYGELLTIPHSPDTPRIGSTIITAHAPQYRTDDVQRGNLIRGVSALYNDERARAVADRLPKDDHTSARALHFLAVAPNRDKIIDYLDEVPNPVEALSVLSAVRKLQDNIPKNSKNSDQDSLVDQFMSAVDANSLESLGSFLQATLENISFDLSRQYVDSDITTAVQSAEYYKELVMTVTQLKNIFPSFVEAPNRLYSYGLSSGLSALVIAGMQDPSKNHILAGGEAYADKMKPIMELLTFGDEKMRYSANQTLLFPDRYSSVGHIADIPMIAELITIFSELNKNGEPVFADPERVVQDLVNHPDEWKKFRYPEGVNPKLARQMLVRRLAMKLPETDNYIETPSVSLELVASFGFVPEQLSDGKRLALEHQLIDSFLHTKGIQKGTPGAGKKLDVLFSDPEVRRAYETILGVKKNDREASVDSIMTALVKELGDEHPILAELRLERSEGNPRPDTSEALVSLEDMADKRQRLAIDRDRWFKEFVGTTIKAGDLSRAWKARYDALSEGIKDTPREIIKWQRVKGFKAYVARLRGDASVQNIPDDETIGRYGGVVDELSRVYDPLETYKALTFLLGNDVEKAKAEARMAPSKVKVTRPVIDPKTGSTVYLTDETGKQIIDDEGNPRPKMNDFQVEILDKDDIRGFTIGPDTGCCMTIGGASRSCITAGYRDGRYGFFAVSLGDKVRAQSLLYVNPDDPSSDEEGMVLVIDNIEANAGTDQHQMLEIYQEAIKGMIERGAFKFKVKAVHLGTRFNEVDASGLEDAPIIPTPEETVYSDARNSQKLVPID